MYICKPDDDVYCRTTAASMLRPNVLCASVSNWYTSPDASASEISSKYHYSPGWILLINLPNNSISPAQEVVMYWYNKPLVFSYPKAQYNIESPDDRFGIIIRYADYSRCFYLLSRNEPWTMTTKNIPIRVGIVFRLPFVLLRLRDYY